MSSPYPVLDNKRIDQWKVTELKEELKRRKLTTKGLKEDLIKRLDEAIRNESESDKGFDDNGFDCVPQPVVQSEDERTPPIVTETTEDIMDESDNRNEETKDIVTEKSRDIMDESDDKNEVMDTDKIQVDVDDGLGSLGKEADIEGESIGGTASTEVEGDQEQQVFQSTSVETSVVVSESVVSEIAFSGKEFPNNETQNKSEDSNSQLQIEDSNPLHEEAKLYSSELNNQVFEVSQVKSDSISTDTVSINEKNELKDNVIADDVKLELDVMPEMAQPSSTKVVLDDGKLESVDVDKLQSMDVEEPHENKVTGEETDCNNAENADMSKKNDSGDVGSAEKLNLDRSSGDDSMEEDAMESKQIDSKFNSGEVGDGGEKTKVPVVKEEEAAVGVMGDDLPAEKKIVDDENKNGLAAPAVKRKFLGLETAVNNETTKRPRRWNTEGLKVLEPQSVNLSPSTTPKDAFQPTFKRSFSRSDSTVSDEAPKERVAVPPSSKPSTKSLRIDRFLRPFTLKAVQELLGKTGTVTSFWMDHIKTHCFVTYSSVDEAVETRNAVYNLQWPPNGGRLLVAEFVDPQEVKVRAEAPQSPATPVSTGPTLPPPPPPPATKQPPEPSPRVQVQRPQLPPPLPLPPPPPLSNPPPARERLLPPPPPLPEKVDPPIVTLDDLFRKTKATPRIYYLPLSDEQVASKPKAQGENVKQ